VTVSADVVITGAGVVSPLGDSPAGVLDALLRAADEPALAPRPAPIDRIDGGHGYEVGSFAPEAYLGDRNLRPFDRTGLLLASAARLALDAAGWTTDRAARAEVGLVAGTMFSSVNTIARFDRHALTAGPGYASPMDFANTVLNAPAGQTAICHHLRGVNSTVAAGAASGLQAVAHAADLVRSGRAAAVLAGGVEELSPESYHGFASSRRLSGADRPRPFETRRNGFALAEGAAVLVLERAATAAARGARPLARVLGHGQGFDPTRGRDDDRAVGAMTRAMTNALADAGLTPGEVDCVSASARGELVGDAREARALATVFAGAGRDPAVTVVKAAAGEALGAAGAVQAVAAVGQLGRGVVPGTPGLMEPEHPFLRGRLCAENRAADVRAILVNSFGFDGHCCALVLSAW
jgi:3-oxoacyl-[acyl-carrier-protein] synthase II